MSVKAWEVLGKHQLPPPRPWHLNGRGHQLPSYPLGRRPDSRESANNGLGLRVYLLYTPWATDGRSVSSIAAPPVSRTQAPSPGSIVLDILQLWVPRWQQCLLHHCTSSLGKIG